MNYFDYLNKLISYLEKLKEKTDITIWKNQKESKILKESLELYSKYKDILKEELDEELKELVKEDKIKLEINIQNLFQKIIFENELNCNEYFLEIHSGAGGTDAQDWAQMLQKMYLKYFLNNHFKVEIVDQSFGDVAGLKSTILKIYHNLCFMYGEIGIHRLVRISPFNAAGKRHTSFASVNIYPKIELKKIHISENDIKIDTYRASGAGGQHVNKTDSAVRIKHLKSGITVQCQNERSQLRNKETALEILAAKLYALQEQQTLSTQNAIEKSSISWSNHFRSYVFDPYNLVKDTKVEEETNRVFDVLDGNLNKFTDKYYSYRINKYLMNIEY